VHVLRVREGRDHAHGQRRRDTCEGCNALTTVTGTIDEACPYCGETSGVQSTPAPPSVQAWSCTACRTDWAITVVNPQPYFDRLAATVELAVARSVLRQVITLADEVATLSDKELRDRLLALADRVGLVAAPSNVQRPAPPVGPHRSGHRRRF
jgi:transposase-like protein